MSFKPVKSPSHSPPYSPVNSPSHSPVNSPSSSHYSPSHSPVNLPSHSHKNLSKNDVPLKIFGCFFHLCQNWWRRASTLKLLSQVIQDTPFSEIHKKKLGRKLKEKAIKIKNCVSNYHTYVSLISYMKAISRNLIDQEIKLD